MTDDQNKIGLTNRDAHADIQSFAAENHIAQKLKALYTTVEREPIPEIFLDLLEKLDAAEQQHK